MIGLITATFFIASASAKLVLGVFAGGKKTIVSLVLAFIIYSICPMLYPLTESATLLLVVRAAQGFAYSFIGTAALVLAGLTVSIVERDKGLGTYTAFLSLGFLAGPAITTFSIPLFGVADTFYFAGIVGFIGIFASSFLYRKLSAIEKDWQIVGVTLDREGFISKVSAILRNRMFAVGFIGNFAFFLLFGVLLAYSPLYIKENLHLDNEIVSVFFILYYVASTITRFAVGRITASKRIGKRDLVTLSTALAAVFSFSLALAPNSVVFAFFFALIGAVQGLIFPVGSMLIAEHIHPSRSVLANSLYIMGIDIGQGIAPLITASIAVQYGFAHAFTMSAAIAAIAALLLAILNMNKKAESGKGFR
jgi:DHA1 family multidrug resistance protein-like MFS transporter